MNATALTETDQIEPMIWTPGVGPDARLVQQLCGVFGQPKIPLGEAWFMGDARFMHDELNAHGLERLDSEALDSALEDVTGGLFSFSDRPEWADWFGYLIPRLLHEDIKAPEGSGRYSHISSTIGLWGLSLRGGATHPARFEGAFASVLSPWVMLPRFWRDGYYMPLRRNQVWLESWGKSGFDDDVCASFFLTWRYLRPTAIAAWVHSILEIDDLFWRAHFFNWIGNLGPVLEKRTADLATVLESNMLEMWRDFYQIEISLKGDAKLSQINLVPPANIEAMREALQPQFEGPNYLRWIDEFSGDDALWPQMEWWLEQVQKRLLAH